MRSSSSVGGGFELGVDDKVGVQGREQGSIDGTEAEVMRTFEHLKQDRPPPLLRTRVRVGKSKEKVSTVISLTSMTPDESLTKPHCTSIFTNGTRTTSLWKSPHQ